MEQAGELVAPARRIASASAPDDDEDAAGEPGVEASAAADEAADSDLDDSQPLTPEEVITDLRTQDRAARARST